MANVYKFVCLFVFFLRYRSDEFERTLYRSLVVNASDQMYALHLAKKNYSMDIRRTAFNVMNNNHFEYCVNRKKLGTFMIGQDRIQISNLMLCR